MQQYSILKPIRSYERLKFLDFFLQKILWKSTQSHQLKLYWEQASQFRQRGNIIFSFYLHGTYLVKNVLLQ